MRISTAQTWANALANLSSAQQRQMEASDQVSTQKKATDLMGYGRTSEVIAAYQSSLERTNSFIEVNQTVTERLNSQNLALETTGQAAADAKQSILNALASNDGATLMLSIQGNFAMALQGLNYQHNGQYLFAGGEDQAPVGVTSLSQLGTTDIDDVFRNGSVRKSSRIDSRTTLQTGMLASDLGKEMMSLFKQVQEYHNDPATGPFQGELTEAQQTFMTDIATKFDKVYNELLEQTSVNGTLQNRVENVTSSLESQASTLTGLIGDRTDVDLSEAYSRLEQAKVTVQASAQVLAGLKDVSLLNLLR